MYAAAVSVLPSAAAERADRSWMRIASLTSCVVSATQTDTSSLYTKPRKSASSFFIDNHLKRLPKARGGFLRAKHAEKAENAARIEYAAQPFAAGHRGSAPHA